MEEPNDPSRSPLCQQKIEKAGTFLKQRANAREKEGRDKRQETREQVTAQSKEPVFLIY